ncbi:MAG: hypothetical protein ACO22K_01215 [Woeseiaceae bacterium]
MEKSRIQRIGLCTAIALIVCVMSAGAHAHGGGNWNAFRIDGVNDNARARIIAIQSIFGEIIRGRSGSDQWPVPALRETRDTLITVKEEVDEVLEHYVIDGINIQMFANLQAEPRAGRTVAASRALDAGIALIDHAASFASADDFIADFYGGGLAARLYELLEAHGERMDLYKLLTPVEE